MADKQAKSKNKSSKGGDKAKQAKPKSSKGAKSKGSKSAKGKAAKAAPKKKAAGTAAKAGQAGGSAGDATGTRAEASLAAFRDAVTDSVAGTRKRIEQVGDQAVKRGQMTREEAEKLVSGVVKRGREQGEELIGEVEKAFSQLRGEVVAIGKDPVGRATAASRRARQEVESARGGVEKRATRVRKDLNRRATKARKRTIKAVDEPLARADRARRRVGVGRFPITAYDQLTVPQIAGRLTELTREELRRVRDYEKRNSARKGVLRAVERELDSGS